MDLSSLPETQQEKLQELQEKFKENQAQRQQEEQQQQQLQLQSQQIQQHASHAYDPTAAYYSYYQQSQNHLQPNQEQQQPQYQQQSGQIPPESGSIQPQHVTVAVSQEGETQNQQIVHPSHDLGVQPQLQQHHQGSSDAIAATAAAVASYPDLNPAAVAALSQLAQFAGTMDAAERAMTMLQGHGNGEMLGSILGPPGPFMGQDQMHSQAGPTPFRGGGRRGGGSPFRGSGHRGFRGWGRGRGGYRRAPPHNVSLESSQTDPSAANNVEATGDEKEPPPSSETEAAGTETLPSESAPVMSDAARQAPQAIRCELCQVECNSLENLEKHINGKKHKKKLQNNPNSTPTENIPGTENLPTGALKRKSGGGGGRGRGGKQARSEPKVVIPIMCDLCNIKCDTPEVFDIHLSGKKHISKLKQFEGHKAMYGHMVHSLYPPNPIASQTVYHPHGHPQQQPYYGHQIPSIYPPPGPYIAPHPHYVDSAPMPVNSCAAPAGMGTYPPNTSNLGN